MKVVNRTMGRVGAAALVALLAAACNDSLSVDATGEVRVLLGRTSDGASASSTSGSSLESQLGSETEGQIQSSDVASLKVTVTSIQFLRAGASESDSSAWISLQLAAPVELDLMALPSEGASPILIDSGSVAVGTYTSVRLFVTNPTIRLKNSISFGVGHTLEADVDYAVTIPSSAQSGIKTQTSFTVSAIDGVVLDVNLLFDVGSSFVNATATGSGEAIVAPVIRARS